MISVSVKGDKILDHLGIMGSDFNTGIDDTCFSN